MTPMATDALVVLVPIYQPHLSPLEQLSLDRSLQVIAGRRVAFVGPHGLDLSRYASRYPGVPFIGFDPAYFASIQGYNLLLLDPAFYRRFAAHEFMLILQTDAVLLRDGLDEWLASPYDYVGAPWPDGVEIRVELDQFAGGHAKRVRAMVGNGGLSLRRNRACAALLEEFPQACELFRRTRSSEDLFFAVMGELSSRFVLPGERVASRFATELKPSHYLAVDGGPPMGGHAWWKYEPALWAQWLGPDAVAALAEETRWRAVRAASALVPAEAAQ